MPCGKGTCIILGSPAAGTAFAYAEPTTVAAECIKWDEEMVDGKFAGEEWFR